MSNPASHPAQPVSPARSASIEEIAPYDVSGLREDFPILERVVHGQRLVYLDNAATTQKPRSMIDALTGYYTTFNANVHRGIHTLAEEATAAYESTRKKMARFIGADDPQQIVFTRNTTESLNLLASSLGNRHVNEGDEILLTEMEHHSNLVPWFLLAKRKKARIRHIPITGDGKLDLSKLDSLLTARTKIVSVVHVSNVLGTINPIQEIARRAKNAGAFMIVDSAQGVPHLPVNVQELGADFVAFSAHKMCGPTGVGVLWGKPELLDALDPYMGGGEMIREVRLDSATWNHVPWKFEAGTPNIADVVAFAAAIDYLEKIGMDRVHRHETRLTGYAMTRLRDLGYITIYGPENAEDRGGVVAFNVKDVHPHDLSTILDHYGVAIRAGHHCAQPLMRLLDVSATARASFYLYNDKSDIDRFVDALVEARKYFGL